MWNKGAAKKGVELSVGGVMVGMSLTFELRYMYSS